MCIFLLSQMGPYVDSAEAASARVIVKRSSGAGSRVHFFGNNIAAMPCLLHHATCRQCSLGSCHVVKMMLAINSSL